MTDLFDIKPPQHFARAGGYFKRERMGRIWRRMIIQEGGLPRDGAVLDAGCGLGRMAIPLMKYLSSRGRYEGFDVDAEAIHWCEKHISAAQPSFRFTAVDVRSARYNPDGTSSAASFVFPYEDSTFDVAFLASVFTHLLPDAVVRYLQELGRVLKPGGRCLASFFLLNDHSERAIAAGSVKPLHRFPIRLDGCRILSAELPESAVAHGEGLIRRLYPECGFRILEPIRYGRWTGHASRSNQDIILAVRLQSAA